MKQYNAKDKLIIVREAVKTNKYKKVCLNYEISIRTLYNWLSKVRRYGVYIEALANKSRVPKNSPNKITSKKIIRKVISLQQEHKCGADKLKLYLKQEEINISRSAVRRILKEQGLWESRKKKKKKKHLGKHVWKFTEAGQKVQIDTKYAYFDDVLYYQFTGIDMASRVVYARLYEEKTAENALDFVRRLVKIFPFKIQCLQADHGIEFTYRVQNYSDKVPHPLDTFCEEQGIKRVFSRIASPWFNGVVERVHGTYKKEFYQYQNQILTLDQAQKKVANFTNYYNQKRLHFSLNGDTPIQRLRKLIHSTVQYV